ncbi:hypothetical protein GU926_04010 [Nibribacter ruber]|uniref:Uncharacterized protein n=1 Tax=Nibribacter ruber TaxID=2698458 RepID=A0A6P1NXK9_9BACT|nr:hypothetical protein [Nibribacter ruber]QHL86648.1 hypothetical protein GU926_04010 [Nibribacter ruber]
MTDSEFDLLDELYFVTPYNELRQQINLPEQEFEQTLLQLIGNGYVKVLFPDQDTEVPFEAEHFAAYREQYYLLATKAGLLAHNTAG